jgi:hypothetical protein
MTAEHPMPGGRRRIADRVAWLALAGLTPITFVAYWDSVTFDQGPLLTLLTVASDLAFVGVGLFLAWRRPSSPIGALLVVFQLISLSTGSFIAGSASQVVDGSASWRIMFQGWLNSWGGAAGYGSLTALAALFPSGKLARGRLGRIARAALAIEAATVIVLMVSPELQVTFGDKTAATIVNPIGVIAGWPGWEVIRVAAYPVVVSGLAIVVGTYVVRFRRARGLERQQLKWLASAFALVLASVVFAFAILFLVSTEGTWMWTPAILTYPLIPASIWAAIMRYRLYDIDRIVSRVIGWAVSSGVLAAVFALLIVGLQAVLAPVIAESTLAVAVSTLVAFFLFQPVRRRVQAAVDRRFDRTRYDAERTVENFAERLRGEVDLKEIQHEMVDTVQAAVRPVHEGVWLRRVTE